ncbi:MAG: dethiobiotin synthase [Nitrospirales bacterium]
MTTGSARQSKQTGQGYFLTGTDTGVGKTAITAALGRALQERRLTIGLMKPVETGVHASRSYCSDTQKLHTISPEQSIESVNQFQFPDPLAPLAAARAQGGKQCVDITVIQTAYHGLSQTCDYTLVEGIGGVMVPLTQTLSVRDLIQALRIPSIVVGRTTLGGVNHLQLTIKSLRSRHIPIVAIVLNDGIFNHASENSIKQRDSTIDLIQELSGLPVFGPIAYQAELSDQWEVGISKLKQQAPIQQLGDFLMAEMQK